MGTVGWVPRATRRELARPTLGWEELAAGGIEVHEIPSDRPTIAEKSVARVLAERLRRYPEAAQAAVPAPPCAEGGRVGYHGGSRTL